MNKTTIYILRHGEIDNPTNIMYGGSKEMSLSNLGRQQIESIGKEVSKEKDLPIAIYTSPMERARESAAIFSKTLGNAAEIVVMDELIDVLIPALVGKPLSIREEIYKTGIDEYDPVYVLQGNESRDAIVNRMYKAFITIVRTHSGRTTALVSHGDPIRFLLYKIKNPNSTIYPPMSILEDDEYLKKGHAIKIIVDDQIKIIHEGYISPAV